MMASEIVFIVFDLCFLVGAAGMIWQYKKLRGILGDYHKQCDDLLKMNDDNLVVLHRFRDQIVILMTTKMMLALFIAIDKGEMEKESYFRNRLIFFGVPRDCLADFDSMNEFYANCENGRYEVRENRKDSPYQFEFVLKEEKHETA